MQSQYLCGANLFGAKKKCGGGEAHCCGKLVEKTDLKMLLICPGRQSSHTAWTPPARGGDQRGVKAIIQAVRDVLRDGDDRMEFL